jgi:hypothetical protein
LQLKADDVGGAPHIVRLSILPMTLQSCHAQQPSLHSLLVWQSCAEPAVAVIAGVHLPPAATVWQLDPIVIAVSSAWKQQTWPFWQVLSSMHPKLPYPALQPVAVGVHVPPAEPMQHSLLDRSQPASTAHVGFPETNTTLVGTFPEPPLQVPPLLPDEVDPLLEPPSSAGEEGGLVLLLQAEIAQATAASVNANEEVFREISMRCLS